MTAMSRASRSARILTATVLIAGCAGPEPSGSPDASISVDASPTSIAAQATSSPEPPAPTATAQATIEPEPTPDGAAPRRTEIEINQNVVDRPGVPNSIRHLYWWQGSDVGLLGTTAQLGLPVGEWVLHAKDGLVLSERPVSDGDRTELLVRRFETGNVVANVRTTLVNVSALLVDRHVFWTGTRPEKVDCAGYNVHGGVWVMDLDDDVGPIAIIEPGQVTGCGMGGLRLSSSPSGETIAALDTNHPYRVDVIDVDSLSRRNQFVGFWPTAITDDSFIQDNTEPSDFHGPGERMTAYNLAGGDAQWSFPDRDQADHFAMSWAWAIGSRFLVEYYWNEGRDNVDLVHAMADPLTGYQRVLLRQHDTREDEDLAQVEGDMSSAAHVTLAFDYSWEGSGPRTFAVIDVDSGQVTWDAYTIDPPWLCQSRTCYRDA
jgi:hypothetical protein